MLSPQEKHPGVLANIQTLDLLIQRPTFYQLSDHKDMKMSSTCLFLSFLFVLFAFLSLLFVLVFLLFLLFFTAVSCLCFNVFVVL
jgi:hypothetical protein